MIARGMTLIETLAMSVLVGLLTAMAAGSLGGSFNAEHPADALRRFDAEVRLLARSCGPYQVSIQRGDNGLCLLAQPVRGRSQAARVCLGTQTVITFSDPEDTLMYDAHGRSADYSVTFGRPPRTLHIAGLTGWSELEPAR